MTDPQPFSQTWCNRTHLQAESRRKARGWSCGCSVCQAGNPSLSVKQEAEPLIPVTLPVISLYPRIPLVITPSGPSRHAGGRPRGLSPEAEGTIRTMGAADLGAVFIQRHLAGHGIKVSVATVSRRLRELRGGADAL